MTEINTALERICSYLTLNSLPMIEKSSLPTVSPQFNMWSLADVDNIPLTCLPVLGDTPWCSETRTFMSVSFTVIGNCAASTITFIEKI